MSANKIEPVQGVRCAMGKRQHIPFEVTSACPTCGTSYSKNLAGGDDYLSYPVFGQKASVYFMCTKTDDDNEDDDCGAEWQVEVVINITIVEA